MRQIPGCPIQGTKQDACKDMCAAWESITPYLITSSWSLQVENSEESPQKVENNKLIANHYEMVSRKREESIRKRIESRRSEMSDLGYKIPDL